jgi:hypothetical protein
VCVLHLDLNDFAAMDEIPYEDHPRLRALIDAVNEVSGWLWAAATNLAKAALR